MERKRRQNGIVQNRIPFERFVRLFAMIEIAFVFIYAKRFATFSVYGNRIWVLVIIVAILAVGSLVLSWKTERNWVSLISGTSMPVLAYEAISMWRYSLAIRIMILAGCFVSVAVGLIWAVKKVNRAKRIRIRREVFVIKAARASRVICCLVLLGACICGKVLIASHYIISYSDIAYVVKPKLGEHQPNNPKLVYTMDFQMTPHQLRHTYITNLIYASVDPKTVQYLAGHENSKVTMDIYAKVKYNKPAQLHGVINRAIDTSKKD